MRTLGAVVVGGLERVCNSRFELRDRIWSECCGGGVIKIWVTPSEIRARVSGECKECGMRG